MAARKCGCYRLPLQLLFKIKSVFDIDNPFEAAKRNEI
jgi:hypothetical protein